MKVRQQKKLTPVRSGEKKRRLTVNSETRVIQVSEDNLHSFIETGLKSMKLIDNGDSVFSLNMDFSADLNKRMYMVHLKKEVQSSN